MKRIVVDIDETLFVSRKICYYLRYFAKILFKLSLWLQKPNLKLIQMLKDYDEVIILTARGEEYRQFTIKQLAKNNIKYDRLIMCDYSSITFDWKRKEVEKIAPCVWIDDMKNRFVGVENY